MTNVNTAGGLTDDARREIKGDAKGYLRRQGVAIGDATQVRVHEDTANLRHFVLAENLDASALTGTDPVSRVAARAARDAGFHAELMKDGTAAIRSSMPELNLPAKLRVEVHQNTADAMHLVLPAAVAAGGALSDADLESVAGGKGGGWPGDISAPKPPPVYCAAVISPGLQLGIGAPRNSSGF